MKNVTEEIKSYEAKENHKTWSRLDIAVCPETLEVVVFDGMPNAIKFMDRYKHIMTIDKPSRADVFNLYLLLSNLEKIKYESDIKHVVKEVKQFLSA